MMEETQLHEKTLIKETCNTVEESEKSGVRECEKTQKSKQE